MQRVTYIKNDEVIKKKFKFLLLLLFYFIIVLIFKSFQLCDNNLYGMLL